MNDDNREPLTDGELSSLLKKWEVAAPPQLEKRVVNARNEHADRARRNWWRFLFTGYIRVPVPVACCLAVVMILMLWRSTKLAVSCVGEGNGLQAVPAVVAAQAPRSIVACPANSKC